MRWPRLFLFLILATNAYGQQADLQPLLYYSSTPFIDQPTKLGLDVINWGPNRATDIEVTWNVDTPIDSVSDPRCHVTGGIVRCRIAAIEPLQAAVLSDEVIFRDDSARVTASVTSATPDPAPYNNNATLPLRPARVEDLTGRIDLPEELGPDETLTIDYEIRNRAAYPAVAQVQIEIPGVEIVSISHPTECGFYRDSVGCGKLRVGAQQTVVIAVTLRLGASNKVWTWFNVDWRDALGSSFTAETSRVYSQPAVVITDADSGEGSLRQAILDVNERCKERGPCRIDFASHFVIRPLTPLPRVAASVIIDQPMTLDGTALVEGDGLTFDADETDVSLLTVQHFPGSAIHIVRGTAYLHNNRLSGNDRGIVVDDGQATIINNSITGNRRSGIFALRVQSLHAGGNTIDGNGASGIFIAEGATSYFQFNRITNNAHFGIALHSDVHAAIWENQIAGNGYGGVDIGLDGPTPGHPVPMPHIERAVFDGQFTIIEGTVPPRQTEGDQERWYEVLLYANSQLDAGGYAQGEEYLRMGFPRAAGHFSVRIEKDLRGKFITGMAMQITSSSGARSSEFSLAVPVTTP